MKPEIHVVFDSVDQSGNKVTIQSPSLAAALAQDRDDQLKALSVIAGSAVAEGDISIDGRGRVVVQNAAFAQAVAKLPQGGNGFFSNNQYCQNQWCRD